MGKVASFGATITDLGPWSAAFQMRYFGPRPLVEDNSQRSATTAIAYARVGYKFNRRWTAQLDAFNLFDRQVSDVDYYYASRLPGEPAEGVNDIHYHPAERRSFRLTRRCFNGAAWPGGAAWSDDDSIPTLLLGRPARPR
jgi:outer membrane receptor protein involved in Fe transport